MRWHDRARPFRFPAASREKLVARPNLTLVEVAGAKHTLPFTHGGELANVVVTAATR